MAFYSIETRATEGYTLIDGHVVSDFSRLANDDANGVVDEHALAEHGGRMDVDAGEHASQARATSREELEVVVPQPMANTVAPDGMDTRVAERDFEAGPRGRVAFASRDQIAPQGGEHGQSLRPSNRAVERYRSPNDGTMTTISLPEFSGRAASCRAAQIAAPEDMPTSRPSSRAADGLCRTRQHSRR